MKIAIDKKKTKPSILILLVEEIWMMVLLKKGVISIFSLESKRLILRRWYLDDVDAVYAYASDCRVGPLAGWNVHTSKHETRRVVQSFIDGKNVYGITIKESGKLIGSIGIHRTKPSKTVRHNAQRELGYVLHPDYWNQGYMTEAVSIITSYCFHTLELECIWCAHFEGNLPSKRVIEKSGFQHEFSVKKIVLSVNNEERLHHYYRLTKENYLNRSE